MEPLKIQLTIPPEFKDSLLAELHSSLKPIQEAIARLEDKIDQGKVVKREMNVKQLADFLNVKPKWIYRQAGLKKDPLPHVNNGKYLSFKVKDVLEWRDRMNGKY